jgi:hypothetical protein
MKRNKSTTKLVADSGKNKKGQFINGHKKLGGRTKGTKNHNGLGIVFDLLEDFIIEGKNLERLKEDFQKKFNQNPTGFYFKLIMPMLPKNINIEGGPLSVIISDALRPKNPIDQKSLTGSVPVTTKKGKSS